MRAHALQLLRELHVILQRELVAAVVEDVARVADRRLADRVRALHRFHADAEIRQIIQRVEDAEDVHAARGRVLHEAGDDVVGIIRVADGVGAAEQHLETDVRHARAELPEALPRILVEEAHRGVEGRAAPHLEREQARRVMRDGAGAGEHVVGADARRHQRLVRVAERRIRDQETLLLERPLGELSRP